MRTVPGGTAAEAAQDDMRTALRVVLPLHIARMARLLAAAKGALNGPDPEAALGYLDALSEELSTSTHPFR